MKAKPIQLKCQLNVLPTGNAKAKAEEDLIVEDPSPEEAQAIIDKAIAKGIENGRDRSKAAEESRTTDLQDSQTEKKE